MPTFTMNDRSTPNREALKAANAGIEAAKEAEAAARVLSERAAAKLEQATAKFRDSQATQHKVLQYRIDSFKAGTSEELPQDLRDERAAGLLAAEDLSHAESLASQMAAELQRATSNVRAAEAVKESALNQIVAEEAAMLTARFKAIKAQERQIHETIRGAWHGVVAPTNADRDAINTSIQAVEPAFEATLMHPPVLPGATKFWLSFRVALIADPDASLPELPSFS